MLTLSRRASAFAQRIGIAPRASRFALPVPVARTLHASSAAADSVAAGEIKEGDLIEIEGGLWRVMSKALSRTAQGRAYVQTEFRHLTEGTKKELRLRSEDFVERIALTSPAKYQVLYVTGDHIAVMHEKTFEQVEIPVSLLGDRAHFLQDGISLVVESHAGAPVLVHLPARMTFSVASVDDAGGTATTAAGFKLRVPKHVKPGDSIVIDTAEGKYVSKA